MILMTMVGQIIFKLMSVFITQRCANFVRSEYNEHLIPFVQAHLRMMDQAEKVASKEHHERMERMLDGGHPHTDTEHEEEQREAERLHFNEHGSLPDQAQGFEGYQSQGFEGFDQGAPQGFGFDHGDPQNFASQGFAPNGSPYGTMGF